MKSVTVLDLRHYKRQKPAKDAEETLAAAIKSLQPPTRYGAASTVETAHVLGNVGLVSLGQENLILGSSPQPRGWRMIQMIATTLGIESPIHFLPTFNDLSSDPNFDKKGLQLAMEDSDVSVSIERTAITTSPYQEYVLARAIRCIQELGLWIYGMVPDGATVLIGSHGACTEMRYIIMRLMTDGAGLSIDQVSDSMVAERGIKLLDEAGGMFNTCEGGIFRNLQVNDSGIIVGCDNIDIFRLPDEVKALKETFK